MKLIGVTGGIGSGKSTICRYIESLGYDVYYSDEAAHALVHVSAQLKKDIITEFGEESYIDGFYNRPYIANIVFNDSDKLDRLNKLFRTHIELHFKEFAKDKSLIFYESALIFELKLMDKFNDIICTYAEEDDIRGRLKIRNGLNDEEIDMRLNNQLSPEHKVALSNYVVDTTDLKLAYEEVDKILHKINNHDKKRNS